MCVRYRRCAITAESADARRRSAPQSPRKSDARQVAARGLGFGIALLLWSCTGRDPPLLGIAAEPPRAATLLPTPPLPVSGPVGAPIGLRSPDAAQSFPGNGPLVRVAAPRSSAATTNAQGDVMINFANADVREVARAVLGEILHLNYVVDPRLQATITVQTGQPLARAAVLPALDIVLRASGAALMETDGVWRVVPVEEAPKTGGSSLAAGPSRPGFGIQVLPLRYVSAAEMRRTLEPFIPAGGVVETDAVRNLLLVSGSHEDRENFAEIVRLFDVDWLKGMSFGLYPLKIGRARQVADELESVFGDAAEGPLAGVLRIVPIERLNAILAISPQADYLREARTWVDRLDYGDDQTTPRFFQYYVQNSRATDLALVLNDLITSAGAGRGGLPQTAPGGSPSEILSAGGRVPTGTRPGGAAAPLGGEMSGQPGGGASQGLTPMPGPTTGGGALGRSGQTSQDRTRRPGGRAGGGTATALRGLRGGGPTGIRETEEGLEAPDIRVVADDKNNALVVFARPRDYRMIEDLIRNLDIVPLQVLIEATIAEVTLNDALRYGLQFFLKSGNSRFINSNANTTAGARGTSANTTNTNTANTTTNLGTGVNTNADLGIGTAAGIVSAVFPGFNYVLAAGNSRLILSALSSVTDVNVVSSPQLLVLDHQTAFLQVGDQVPVALQSAVSILNPGAPIVNSIAFRDTGVILQVTPRVNTTGLVTMEVEQEVSDVVKTTSSNIDSPTIAQRRIVSTVIVQDGQTVALGGLIKDSRDETRSGVPVLSDLPLIGALFRNTTKGRGRTELLVLLTPSVVRSPEQARRVTDELRERMQNVRPLGYRVR
jgi:general secretion pathway protein D